MSSPPSPTNGNPRHASSADVDPEARTASTDAPFVLPTLPELARPATSPLHAPLATGADSTNDSSRVTPSCESQRDLPRGGTLPPPYADTELPAYTTDPEPVTLAKYLFKLGFLFPPLWTLGAVILIFPFAAPKNLEATKSEEERQELVQTLRVAELKWAQRCAWALFVLFVLAGVAVALAFAVFHQ